MYAPSSSTNAPPAVADQWFCVEMTHTTTSIAARIVLPDTSERVLPEVDGVKSPGLDDQWIVATGNSYNWGDGVWQLGDALRDIEIDDVRVGGVSDLSVCNSQFQP